MDPSAGSESERLDEPFQQACEELRRRLRSGESCGAEEFFHRYPTLESNQQLALELLRVEWRTRRELNLHTTLEDWLARFPQWEELLRSLFGDSAVGDSARMSTVDEWRGGERTFRRAELPAPVSLDHHELLEELGRGGMGVVHRARDTILKRHVALKRIRAGVLAGAREVERFYREAQAAARLEHPHIIKIHGMGLYRGEHCYTMTLVTGGTLAEHKDSFRDPRAAVALIAKVAAAVHAAHQQGILHRDLKPANIFLDDKGEPLVGDFGLAKLLDPDVEQTQSGGLIGTPAYMSPEQFPGARNPVTAQSDVWALGVILYELLTGRRPFPGRTWQDLESQVNAAPPPRPGRIVPGIDSSLEPLVLKCLERDPRKRYATADALADDLTRWLRGERSPGKSRARSRFRFVAAAALLALGTAAVFLGPETSSTPLVEPEEEPEESLTLIGADGKLLVEKRWLIDKEDSSAKVQEAEKAFTLTSPHLSSLELCTRPPWPEYRLEAEVRHDENPGFGVVGLFLGRGESMDAGRGLYHCTCRLTFSDREEAGGFAAAEVRWYGPVGPSMTTSVQSVLNRVTLENATNPSDSWRTLSLEVRRQTVAASCGRKSLGEMTHAALIRAGEEIMPHAADIPFAFAARGGLGIFVDKGKASFRRVTIKPLKSRQSAS